VGAHVTSQTEAGSTQAATGVTSMVSALFPLHMILLLCR
jgi:hypothetical protein